MLSAARLVAKPVARTSPVRPAPVSRMTTQCTSCKLREVCLPCGLDGMATELLGEIVHTRIRVRRGESLLRAGAPFDSLYAVRSGFFKSSVQIGRAHV